MKSFKFLLLFFFCACAPTTPPPPPEEAATAADNIKTIEQVAAQKKVSLIPNRKYAIYEKWAPKGRELYECVTGWSHTRLVVGTYKQKSPDSCEYEFKDPKTFDLGRTGQDKKGGQVQIKGDKWRANHYLIGTGNVMHWHRASADSQYSFAGEVKDDMKDVEDKAKKYEKDHPTYNLATNNCLTFANELYKGIK